MSDELDLLVLGSGVAGLSAAVRAATEHDMATGVLTKGSLDQATTRWAQGGVAAALSRDPEEIDLHLADTLAAGAGATKNAIRSSLSPCWKGVTFSSDEAGAVPIRMSP